MKKAKYITTNRRERGFTMIELMITITLVAVLASIAVPSMRTYVLNNRLNSVSQEFLRTLQTARSEATKRQLNVVVCTSGNPEGVVPLCAGTPIGWIMFEDRDSNWVRTSTETLLETHTFDSSKMHMLADGSKRVAYLATGFASPAGATALIQTPSTAIVMCDYRGNVDANGGTDATNSVARGIIIAPTGRVRITRALADIDAALTDDEKINSSCPP